MVAQEFVAGPLLGGSFSQVDGDSFKGYQKFGFQLGGFVYRKLTDRWDVQLEIKYAQKGSRKTPNYDIGDYTDYKIHLNYIQFPLLARYNFEKFSLEAGLSIGNLLSETEEYEGLKIPEEDKVQFETMEYATLIGGNYYFNNKLWVNFRFSYSLNRIRIPYGGRIPIYNPRPHWLSREPGQYNNVATVSVYYAF